MTRILKRYSVNKIKTKLGKKLLLSSRVLIAAKCDQMRILKRRIRINLFNNRNLNLNVLCSNFVHTSGFTNTIRFNFNAINGGEVLQPSCGTKTLLLNCRNNNMQLINKLNYN